MGYTSYVHDPDAVLDYQWDWSDWLATDDFILDADVEIVDPADGSSTNPLNIDSFSFDTSTVTAWISGGDAIATPYTVTCHIYCASGREDDRSISLKIKER